MTWRAVLVAGDDESGDAVNATGSHVVRLREHRVHALEHALDDAGGLSEPGRRGKHEDLGREQLRVDGGHSSPSPSSEETPGSRLRSTARIISQVAPPRSRASLRTCASASVLEARRRGLEGAIQDEGIDETRHLLPAPARTNRVARLAMLARLNRGPNEPLIGLPGSRSELGTPALVLDLDVLDANIASMAAHARMHGYALRPVAKMHKSVDIARRQSPPGALACAVRRSRVRGR